MRRRAAGKTRGSANASNVLSTILERNATRLEWVYRSLRPFEMRGSCEEKDRLQARACAVQRELVCALSALLHRLASFQQRHSGRERSWARTTLSFPRTARVDARKLAG